MADEVLSPQELIDAYGLGATVAFGDGDGRAMTLAQALQFEEMFCTGDKAARQDPERRVRYLAGRLAAGGSLRPEHAHLLEVAE